jgi:ABC-type multidrug transport system ATPase subunit
VNNKKVEEVKSWLQQATAPNPKSHVLLLVGPPGSGKTTMMNVLLNNFRVVHYEHDMQNDEWNVEVGISEI